MYLFVSRHNIYKVIHDAEGHIIIVDYDWRGMESSVESLLLW